MVFRDSTYSVLIVSPSEQFNKSTMALLPPTTYWPVRCAETAGEARRLMIDVKYDLESCGTLGLLELLPHFVAANHDTVAVIDEIDNGIHDYLLKELIESIAPCIHGQLIFTTHNMLFLENYDFKDKPHLCITP